MLTREDIAHIPKFNLKIVEEGIRQAEQMLSDCFSKKESIEKKAFTLLSVFLSFSIALLSIPKITQTQELAIYLVTIPTGLCFLLSSLYLFRSLRPANYGTMGRYPDTWLQPGVLEGDDDMRGYVLANVLFDYQDSIRVSSESNDRKAKLVTIGLGVGMTSPILFIIMAFINFTLSPHL